MEPDCDFHDVTNQLSNLMNLGHRPYYNHEDEVNEDALWIPAVNISEDDSAYYIDLEVPGVEKEDIQINYENGVITVNGERKRVREPRETKFIKKNLLLVSF